MSSESITSDTFYPFLRKYYWDEILELASSYPEKKDLIVRYDHLDMYSSGILRELLENDPATFITSISEALQNIDIPIEKDLMGAGVQVINLPVKTPISLLRKENINDFISVEGIISQAQDVKPKATEIIFKCLRCETEMVIPQTSKKLVEPMYCENETCGKRGPFKELIEKTTFIDTQNIILQEPPESMKGKTNPDSLDIYLEGNLVGKLNAGDRVVFNGVLKVIPITGKEGKTSYYEYLLMANSYEKISEDYEDIEITQEDIELIEQYAKHQNLFPMLIQSIAPAIKGYDPIKEALVLQLFGGTSKVLSDGTKIRGNTHIMLMGDPGVAKSQLLRKMIDLSPRGVFASGKGGSIAGLTAAAIKDEYGRWTLQAGALVLADGGLAAIDEMDKMNKEEISAFHEAMEQQSISVNKAGINSTLRSRCAILGAANPKYGRFDQYESTVSQINLPPAIISRFDLIFLMLDIPDEQKDKEISEHILLSHQEGVNIKLTTMGHSIDESASHKTSPTTPVIPTEIIKKYVAYARRTITPQLPTKVIKQLEDFYLELRIPSAGSQEKPISVTARQLEGLIRLTEASARARLSQKVEKQDVDRTIRLVLTSMDQTYKDPMTGQFDVDIISSGTSKSQRDVIKIIKGTLKDMSKEYSDRKIPIESLLEELENNKISKEKAEEVIEKLRRSGDVLIPKKGYITFIE